MNRFLVFLTLSLSAFVAITALAGGVALLTGAEDTRFPATWLEGAPFSSYLIPALLLSVVVGGSSLTAMILLIRKHPSAWMVVVLAGSSLCAYIGVEVLILKQDPPGPTALEMVYFFLGILMILPALGIRLSQQTESR
ncbi:MAG: hypothetical protein HUU10_13460 [Bacteroidetes bacterium]|nr:hypothetical protein [Bacteroidota bacterium]